MLLTCWEMKISGPGRPPPHTHPNSLNLRRDLFSSLQPLALSLHTSSKSCCGSFPCRPPRRLKEEGEKNKIKPKPPQKTLVNFRPSAFFLLLRAPPVSKTPTKSNGTSQQIPLPRAPVVYPRLIAAFISSINLAVRAAAARLSRQNAPSNSGAPGRSLFHDITPLFFLQEWEVGWVGREGWGGANHPERSGPASAGRLEDVAGEG